MDPEHARRLEELYHSALQRNENERAAFLRSACGPDASLREELESLLVHDREAGSFIESPAMEVAARLVAQQRDSSDRDKEAAVAGQIVSHYRILQKLGGGGMGVVYRAQDVRLGRSVALKFLPEAFAHDAIAIERFRREARAASSLNHPNICTIYDIDESESQVFIAMEYLDGQTLKHLIDSQPLDPGTCLCVAAQIATALEAAHSQGIIHRDIKPANIFVTRRGDAKILDFGLAKLAPKAIQDTARHVPSLPGAVPEIELTTPGTAIGTVAYMSPEQARGEDLDARTDLFSFGAVLYEMATGQRAFAGRVMATIFDAILNHDPAPLTDLSPGVPVGFVDIINKALVKNRDERYQSAAAMLADLKAVEADLILGQKISERANAQSAKATSVSSRRPWWIASAGVVIVMAVALIASLSMIRQRRSSPTRPVVIPSRRSVAVVGFRDLTGSAEDAWLSTALAEMLNTELAAGEKLRLVSGEDVARTKLDLHLPDADSFSKETLARVRKSLGADVVILGSYASLGGQSKNIRVDLHLQDTVAGETIAEVATTGTEADLFDLVSRAGTQLREKLGVGAVSTAEVVNVKASLPASPEAARLYAEGLRRLRVFDALAARDLLERAVSADPKYPLARAALATAWSILGNDKKAKSEAGRAFHLSTNLSRQDRLVVEGDYHLINHEYDKAIEVYRTLFTLFPDNLDYGLRLAVAQKSGSKPNDSLATIAVLRKLPPPASDDPRIDLQEAQGWMGLENYQRAQEPLKHAIEEGRGQEARLLVARALEMQCRVAQFLGQMENAIAACREASDTYATAGNHSGEAAVLRTWADAIMEADAPGAIALDRQALDIYRRIGNEAGVAATSNSLGLIYTDQGELNAATKSLSESASIYRRLADTGKVGLVTSNLANVRVNEGDLTGAMNLYEQALLLDRESGSLGGAAVAGLNKASVQVLKGDLSAAKLGFEESLKTFQKDGDSYDSGFAFFCLGDLLLKEDDLAGARKALEQSLEIRKASGEKVILAETQMTLAELSIEEGRALSDAEAVLRQAIATFEQENERDDEAKAWGILTQVLVAEHKFDEAKQGSEQALSRSKKSRTLEIRMQNEIVAARLQGLGGSIPPDLADRSIAKKRLASVLSKARERGYVGIELEARLAVGEIEMKAGPTPMAESHLGILERDTHDHGFGLIAQKAAAARASRKSD